MSDDFEEEKRSEIKRMGADDDLRALGVRFVEESSRLRYSYHFTWLGLPIIQFPADIVALQEIVWRARPEVIVETGVARGGSVLFFASLLELLGGDGHVVGVDIEIRPHNRAAIECHPLSKRVELVEGSSVADETVRAVRRAAEGKRALVILDSNHTEEHVLRELELYSPLVRAGSYLVVMDTIIADLPADYFPDRPWTKTANPRSAVRKFLAGNGRFVVDEEYDAKLLVTAAPGGYLKCVKD